MYINKATVIKNINKVRDTKTTNFGSRIKDYTERANISKYCFVNMVDAIAHEVGEKFTMADVGGYINKGINPKANKLAAVIKATGMPYEYWTGAIEYDVARAMREAGMTK